MRTRHAASPALIARVRHRDDRAVDGRAASRARSSTTTIRPRCSTCRFRASRSSTSARSTCSATASAASRRTTSSAPSSGSTASPASTSSPRTARSPRSCASLYGRHADGSDRVEDMDLLVGTLCEGHRPPGFGFGETLFQVFILNASWRLLGDRFYTDDFREGVYSREGLDWIDAATMKSVLLRHFPSLADTALANVQQRVRAVGRGPPRPGAPSAPRVRPVDQRRSLGGRQPDRTRKHADVPHRAACGTSVSPPVVRGSGGSRQMNLPFSRGPFYTRTPQYGKPFRTNRRTLRRSTQWSSA